MKLRHQQQIARAKATGPAWVTAVDCRAFSLLEVMIAMAIFFMAIFAILELTSQNLRLARSLQQTQVSPASVAAEYFLTNLVEEGSESGDFGNTFPGYTWTRHVSMVSTDGLFQVEITIAQQVDLNTRESTLSYLLYRPDSAVLGRPGGSR